MLILCLASCLSLHMAPEPDTSTVPAQIYAAVVEHAWSHTKRWAPGGVTLTESLYLQGRTPQPGDTLSPEIVEQLHALDFVHPNCSSNACASLRLGPVVHLPPGARVRVLGDHQGIPLNVALQAIPESAAVPADVRVDVVIGTPCEAPAGSESCRFPNVSIFRYFLRLEPERGVTVVTRWLFGGA